MLHKNCGIGNGRTVVRIYDHSAYLPVLSRKLQAHEHQKKEDLQSFHFGNILDFSLELSISYPFRLNVTEAHLLVLFVLTVRSFEIEYFGVPLKRQDMGTD